MKEQQPETRPRLSSPVLSPHLFSLTQTTPVYEPSLSGHIPASVYFGDNELPQYIYIYIKSDTHFPLFHFVHAH